MFYLSLKNCPAVSLLALYAIQKEEFEGPGVRDRYVGYAEGHPRGKAGYGADDDPGRPLAGFVEVERN